MYLLSAENFLSGKPVQVLCWTLVHSLWQGLLLAGIAALIIVFTGKSNAQKRYNLLIGALAVFVAAVFTTFLIQLNGAAELSNAATLYAGEATQTINNVVLSASQTQRETTLLSTTARSLDQYASIIVLCWMFIIGMRCIAIGVGFYGIQRIKTRKLSSVGSYWSMRVQQLAAQLNIKTKVQFFQSEIVKVPMVVGHLKPIIFFPLGALAALPPDDVEAILLHELAHIRRSDYIVNMLQHFAEILFFFNPAVLWVSGLIKTERENCCDDLALAQMNNKRNYIQALVSFQEFDASLPVYATALSGRKDHLLQRVKRIVSSNNKSLNMIEKTFLVICFLLTGTLTVVFSQKNKATGQPVTSIRPFTDTAFVRTVDPADVAEGAAIAEPDNDPEKPRTHYIFKKNGVLYETYGDRTWMKVNGQMIPQSQWKSYDALINGLIREYHIKMYEKDSRRVTDSPPVKEADQKAANTSQADIIHNIDQSRSDSIVAAKASFNSNINMQNLSVAVEPNEKINTNINTKTNTKIEVTSTTTNPKYRVLTGLSYSTNYTQSAADYTRSETNYYNGAENPKDVDVQALTEEMIADLANEKLITKREGLSYQLSNDALIVNGKTQREAVHNKLKKKYIKSPDWKLMYNWKERSK